MKQFKGISSAILLGIGVVVIWVFLQAFTASSHDAENANLSIEANNKNGGMLVSVSSEDVVIPLTGINQKNDPVFGPTGMIMTVPSEVQLDATHLETSTDAEVAPVFGPTGVVMTDPSEIQLDKTDSEKSTDAEIAPVYGPTGVIMTDPSDIGANATNP